jgi:hypothetical protein
MEISNFEKTKIGGEFEARGNFKMKASAKAFRILSDGLYQNKIAAVIRELSTNAHDSHVAAKKATEPFLVHLPSNTEPYFSVRDFGVGMAPEVLEELYVTYFDSTKTTSNDFTGCLGLGSKSPFSYSDNFSITSFWEGRKRVYLARLDSEGMPCIDLIQDEESTEPTGIEVRVNCKANDVGNWIREASAIYPYFDVTPTFTGHQAIEKDILKFKKSLEKIGEKDFIEIFLIKESLPSKIIMGNVAYPMPRANTFFDQNADNIQRQVLDIGNFVIKVPIGMLDIAASRESLSIDVNTKRNLQKIVGAIRDIIVADIQKNLTQTETVYKGICLIDEIQKKYPKISLSDPKIYNLNFTVDGKDIQKAYHNPRALWDSAMRETVSPKVYTVSKGAFSGTDVKTKEEYLEGYKLNSTSVFKYTKNIPYQIYQSRIGLNDLTRTIGIIIDGEKELVYERVIEQYMKDLLEDFINEEINSNYENFKNRKGGTVFTINAIVLRAYENEGRLEEKATQKFLDKFHLTLEDDLHFVSEFKDNYKIVRDKKSGSTTPKAKKQKSEEFSMPTYQLVSMSSGANLADYYASVIIEQSMADETIHYIPRDGLYWNIPELGIQTQHSYSYNRPSTGKIFNFLKSCGKDIKIYALTETQIDRLKKKGFELNSLGEDLVDLLEAEVSTLEKDDVKFYYDQVVKSNHLEEWRETLLKAKGKDNETFVDFLLTDYLQNKLSSTSFFDSKKVEKFKNISSFADLLSTGHLFKNRLATFWKKIEDEQSKIQASAPSGDLLVEKMVQAIPPLLHWNHRLYYAKSNVADKRNFIELLNFLNKVEAHKKL